MYFCHPACFTSEALRAGKSTHRHMAVADPRCLSAAGRLHTEGLSSFKLLLAINA